MQKLTKFKVIFDLFTVCVYFIQQQNCKLYYIYLMIISEIQSKIGHCSCDSAKLKAPADFSHDAILLFDIVLNWNEINQCPWISFLFCGHDLPNNGHHLRVFAILMAIEKEKKQDLMSPLVFSSLLGL